VLVAKLAALFGPTISYNRVWTRRNSPAANAPIKTGEPVKRYASILELWRGCGISNVTHCRFSSVSSYETASRTSQHFQTMREQIRERLGVRSGHTDVEKRGNDSHEHPVQDEA
jgi:hypothetical protein